MQNGNISIFKGYIMVFVASLLFFYEFGLNNIFDALAPHIANDLHISAINMGLISSIFFYIEVLLLIPAGIVLDRVSAKNIIILVICLSAVGVLMTANANSMAVLIIGRILMGIGGTFSFIGCIRIAVNSLPAQHLAKGTSLIVSMGLFGGFIVQMPLTLMITTLGWRHSLLIVSVAGFIIAFLIFLFVTNKRYYQNSSTQHANSLSLREQFSKAFLNKQNVLCGIYNSLMNLPIFMLGAMWGITYLTVTGKFTEVQASTICSMLFLGIMFGSPLASIISDAVKSRVKPMKIGAILSIALILILILFPSQNFYFALIMFLLLGLITSTQNLSYPTVIESNSKAISSSATAVISLLCMVGGAISQPLFGSIVVVLQHHYSKAVAFEWGFNILPVAFVLSYLISLFIKETHCKSIAEN